MAAVFFLTVTALSGVAVLILVPIILRKPDSPHMDRRQKNIEVAHHRLDELQQREEAGEVSETDAEQIREEIERGLLDDLGAESVTETPETGAYRNKINFQAAAVIAILVPVAAGSIYLAIGEPGVIVDSSLDDPAQSAVNGNQLPADFNNLSLEARAEVLQQYVAENPNDDRAWFALGATWVDQRKYPEAIQAFMRARELAGDSAEVLVREAFARILANDRELTGEPATLVAKALQLDPNHQNALLFAGMIAEARQDFAGAIDYWRRLERQAADEETLSEVSELIARAQSGLNQTAESAISAIGSNVSVRVRVAVAPAVLEKVEVSDTLFVLARAIDGPPMPLAAVKKQVQDLPLVVDLDDSLAMVPNLKISAFDEVVIVARISRSGQPIASSGDYFGESGAIRPGSDQEVNVLISKIVP